MREAPSRLSGRCRLCLQAEVKLENSHVIPAGFYRLLRDSGAVGNPNPWIMRGKTQVQTSAQERAYLFCRTCEHRLNVSGERWMFRNGVKRDGSFPLRDLLAGQPSVLGPQARPWHKAYLAANIPSVDVNAIAYFAASVFWRASIHLWRDSEYQVRLGPYSEIFRGFLMGEAVFPKHAFLNVRVRLGEYAAGLCQYPSRLRRVDDLHAYVFTMPGINFHLFVGRNAPGYVTRSCIVHGHGSPILVSDSMERCLVERASREISQ